MSSIHTSARSDAPIENTSTETTPVLSEPVADEFAWRQADENVFVATNAGEYAGFVTVEQDTHIVHDNHSRRVGSYSSLAAARQALVDATRPPSRRRERLRRRILDRRR